MAPMIFEFDKIKIKVNQDDHLPPHCHAEGLGASVRVNLNTMEFMDEQTDFSNGSLHKIMAKVIERREQLLEEWERYHGQK